MAVKHTMYQRKVDVDTLNAIKSMLADVSSVSPSSEQRYSRMRILFQNENAWNEKYSGLLGILSTKRTSIKPENIFIPGKSWPRNY